MTHAHVQHQLTEWLMKLLKSIPFFKAPQLEDMDVLEERYARWRTASGWLTFFSLCLCVAVWQTFIVLMARRYINPPPDAQFVFRIEEVDLMVFALPLGICSCLPPVWGAFRLLLRNRYDEFVRYCDAESGMRGKRIVMVFAVPTAVVALFLLPFVLDELTYLTHDDLVVNDFWGFGEQHHPYYDIVEIRTYSSNINRAGETNDRTCCEIVFTNGYTWTLFGHFNSDDPLLGSNIGAYVRGQTGVPIKRCSLPAVAPRL